MISLQTRMRRMLFALLTVFACGIVLLYNYGAWSDMAVRIREGLQSGNGYELPYVAGMPAVTVLLDKRGGIRVVLAHESLTGQTEDLAREAEELARHPMQNWNPGLLWGEEFAWMWHGNGALTVAYIRPLTQVLKGRMALSVLLFGLAEICIWFTCRSVVRRMTRPVEETLEKQKRFIQDASHELKTPLAVILASAEAMETDPDSRWLAAIQMESGRMDRLVKTMLDLSTAEQDLPQSRLDLSRTAEQASLPYEALLFEKGCRLDMSVQKDVFIRGNRDSILQLVGILLDNAGKHAKKDSAVCIYVRAVRNKAVLEVSNRGEPIPAGEEEKIFARFYRVDKARNRSEGRFGLGLAIAKTICDSHDASIVAQSKEGITTFTVVFPLLKG